MLRDARVRWIDFDEAGKEGDEIADDGPVGGLSTILICLFRMQNTVNLSRKTTRHTMVMGNSPNPTKVVTHTDKVEALSRDSLPAADLEASADDYPTN